MISLEIATKDWERDGVWKIAPAGVSWIKEGDRASIGDGAIIGNGASIGDWASIGDRASIGDEASIGDRASIGDEASIGNGASIGDGAIIGNGASIGNGARIGDWAIICDGASIGNGARIGNGASIGASCSDAVDIGFADGYRKCIAQIKGVAWIGAGCRWFTLADALKHWSAKEDRDMTMCLMMSAIHIAEVKGWSHD